MRKSVLIAFILLFTFSYSFAKINFIEIDTKPQWEEVISTAKKENKIIFAVIYAEWCEPCQELDAKTFLDNDLSTYMNANLLAVKISSEKSFGKDMIEKRQIKNVPVMYIMDPAGNIISEEIRGYRTAGKLLDAATYFKQQYQKLLDLKEEYYSIKRNHDIELSYAFMLLHLKYAEEAEVVANQYFRNIELFSYAPEEWTLVKQYVNDVNEAVTLKVVAESDAFKAVNGKAEVDAYLGDLFRYNYALAIQKRDVKQLENTLLLVDKIDFSDAGLMYLNKYQIREFFRISFYERINDWNSYAKTVDDYVANNQVDDKDMRNFIQNFYIHVIDIELMDKADSWASKLLKKDKIFQNYVLYCLTQYKTGSKSKAFKLLKKAEKKALTEDDFKVIENIKQEFGRDLIK